MDFGWSAKETLFKLMQFLVATHHFGARWQAERDTALDPEWELRKRYTQASLVAALSAPSKATIS